MDIEVKFFCPECRNSGVFKRQVLNAEATFVFTVHQCHYMLCRRYYFLVINLENPKLFYQHELNKHLMDVAPDEEKKKHVALSFIEHFSDEVKESIGASDRDIFNIVGVEEYTGSTLLTYEDLSREIEDLIQESGVVDPITDDEVEATKDYFLSSLDRGHKLPWE